MRFSHGRINQRAKTNIFVPAEHWDSDNQKIEIPNFRKWGEEQEELVKFLLEQQNKIENLKKIIADLFNDTDKINLPPDWLKIEVDKFSFPEKYITKTPQSVSVTLFQFIAHFIENASSRKDKKTGRQLGSNIIQNYKATEKHLKEFAKTLRKKDFEFSELDQKFYDKFVSYLQSHKKTVIKNGKPKIVDEHFTQNTVGKHIRVLKIMLNDAQTNGICDIPNMQSVFYVFSEETDTIYLNEDELQQLKDTDFSETPHLDRVRDWFLLLAWTGCRFSDLSKITKTDIKGGFITFRQQKTNNKVTIPLHPVVIEILEKYDYDLPTEISNQRFNEYIKTVCEKAELKSHETTTRTVGGKLVTETFEKWELVTSHTGRRSFCTNMYKRGLPTLMIMSVSGHKTEKAFLKYIKVKQEEHAEMMAQKWAEMYGKSKK